MDFGLRPALALASYRQPHNLLARSGPGIAELEPKDWFVQVIDNGPTLV